ncbi:MAG: hypothetical protein AB1489_04440 [Acidobacteriota bacterium]
MRFIAFTTVILLLCTIGRQPSAVAWSHHGHVIITRAAVKLVLEQSTTPAQLQALLREGLGDTKKLSQLENFVLEGGGRDRLDAGLDLFSFRPDELVAAKSPVPAFNSTEALMHYLDLEEFHPDPTRRKFAPDGSNKVRIEDLPRDPLDSRYQSAGFVTFRAEQCYRSLVESLATNYSNEQIFLWLGYLSHYIGDAYQPYHATIDYQGLNCPCNQNRPQRHNFHPDMEGTLFRDERPAGRQLRARFWQHFQAALTAQRTPSTPEVRLDPYFVTRDALLSGYDYLPMLCRAGSAALVGQEFDPDAWFSYREKVGQHEITILQLKAERMAQATIVLRTLILQAWQEAEQIRRGKSPSR